MSLRHMLLGIASLSNQACIAASTVMAVYISISSDMYILSLVLRTVQ